MYIYIHIYTRSTYYIIYILYYIYTILYIYYIIYTILYILVYLYVCLCVCWDIPYNALDHIHEEIHWESIRKHAAAAPLSVLFCARSRTTLAHRTGLLFYTSTPLEVSVMYSSSSLLVRLGGFSKINPKKLLYFV